MIPVIMQKGITVILVALFGLNLEWFVFNHSRVEAYIGWGDGNSYSGYLEAQGQKVPITVGVERGDSKSGGKVKITFHHENGVMDLTYERGQDDELSEIDQKYIDKVFDAIKDFHRRSGTNVPELIKSGIKRTTGGILRRIVSFIFG